MQKRYEEFFKQSMIAAMQSLIQARAIAEAAQTNAQVASIIHDGNRQLQYEVDDELFSHSFYCGVGAEINLHNDGGGKYTWGQLLAEESNEIAKCMVAALAKEGI
jgi:hypothetical protein